MKVIYDVTLASLGLCRAKWADCGQEPGDALERDGSLDQVWGGCWGRYGPLGQTSRGLTVLPKPAWAPQDHHTWYVCITSSMIWGFFHLLSTVECVHVVHYPAQSDGNVSLCISAMMVLLWCTIWPKVGGNLTVTITWPCVGLSKTANKKIKAQNCNWVSVCSSFNSSLHWN